MTSDSGPTVRRRRLSGELKRLRVEAGKSREEVAERLGCHPSKVSRIETGRVGVNSGDARLMLEMYGVPEADIGPLIALARQSRQKGWWHAYNDILPDAFDVYVGLESEAASILTYEGLLIPGLLQTQEYAQAITHARWPTTGPSEAERRIHVRMARQDVLTREPAPLFWAVIDEAALHREVGDLESRKTQIRRLAEVSDLPNVEVQIIPFSSGAHGSMDGSFRILTFPDPADRSVVHLENLVGSLYLEMPHQVDRYTLVFDRLRASALGPPESVALIIKTIRELG
ncbi:helix-turn-helix domain-containing protein [Sphaerisporangium corydalis]|uniref:Helix-turn-helix domain-containing protein n=1 Tax=Sphaerisporangium corydalis TaxID=1441875 RepID=A0ABV9EFR8_9ACTN|nr:helix-turn-helix transcriptional regulator [Sphaerisporangium corydalis]